MEPITLSVLTASLTLLATEAGKGMASEAGKSAWAKFKDLAGWDQEPEARHLPERIAGALLAQPDLQPQVVDLLRQEEVGLPSQMVGSIVAKNVVVAHETGDITFTG